MVAVVATSLSSLSNFGGRLGVLGASKSVIYKSTSRSNISSIRDLRESVSES